MVTRFQQAVLQEMGIPLWVSQEEASSTQGADAELHTEDSVPAQQTTSTAAARSNNSSGHLAAIRQSLSDKKPDKKTVSPATTDTPESQPRALPEQALTSAFMDDVRAAFAHTDMAMPAKVNVGEALALTSDALTLPAEPDKLNAGDKRRLWALIVDGPAA